MEIVDPKSFGLNDKTKLFKDVNGNYIIEKIRKSRIIMADGKKILDQCQKIWQIEPGVQVTLKTNAPICSKTTIFFKDNNIKVEKADD